MKIYLKITGVGLLLTLLVVMSLACEPDNGEVVNDEVAPVEENGVPDEENDAPLAPEFQADELFSGETKQFPDDWEEKVIYLNFFSTG